MLLESTEKTVLWAKETMEEEARALSLAAERIDHNFSSSIKIILASRGKVVVAGLGKSGHVAKKIAATFSSCGIPSVYLHPSEALHGDLGILETNDILLALAYSGETYETLKVAKYAKNMNLKVIALTGKIKSSLAELSDFCLDGSVTREVCPNELAPTSSTTVAMALGDALAVSFMKAKNFTARDFARFHPEGLLGRKLALVSEYTRKDMLPVSPNMAFEKIAEHMSNPNYGVTIVKGDSKGEILGIITDGDLRRFFLKPKDYAQAIKAKDIMTKKPKSIGETESAYSAAKIMEKLKISSLVVTSHEKGFVGIIRLQDLIMAKIF